MKNKLFKSAFTLLILSFFASACAMQPKHTGKPVPQDHLAEIERPDIPLVMNNQVQDWLDFFQGNGRERFGRFLSRSGKYIPMMKRVLKEHQLPANLVYLSMIESGFNPHAYSRARATGAWQFMYRTGIRYGLKVDSWVDERRDPEKSTVAAAQYLKDLHDRFNHWYLAAAGYNAGEGKIGRAIRKYDTEDFWELTRGKYLKSETKNYVPKLIAAALIAKNPEKYGFTDIEYEDPIIFDEVTLESPIDLRIAAQCAGVTYDEIKGLNPELLHWVTPPTRSEYQLKIPPGTAQRFEKKYAELSPQDHMGKKEVAVKTSTSIHNLAKRHRTVPLLLAVVNGLSMSAVVPAGKTILLPLDPPAGERFVERRPEKSYRARHHRRVREARTASKTRRRVNWSSLEKAQLVSFPVKKASVKKSRHHRAKKARIHKTPRRLTEASL